MKKIIVLFLSCGMMSAFGLPPLPSHDEGRGVNLEARIMPSKRALRLFRKKIRVAREVDSLILNRNFQFRPVEIHTEIPKYVKNIRETKMAGGPPVRSYESLRVLNGWFKSALAYAGALTDNMKFVQCVKTEDKRWFMTIDVDLIDQGVNRYEFVSDSTGWTVLRVTSKSRRWGGWFIYTGWLIDN